jgi:hypothetical protein
MLEKIGQPNVPYGFEGFAQNTSGGPNPCNPGANYAGYQAAIDGSVELFWVSSTRSAEDRHRKRKI